MLENLIKNYIHSCQKTDWLDNELYKFEWAKWVNDNINFDTTNDDLLYKLALDSQKQIYTNSTGVQFIKQGARKQMSKFIGTDDIAYFREFKEGKTLTDIGFELRNMSFPIISCWLAAFCPEKIFPVSRTSFADVIRKVFSAKVNNSGIAYIESLQPYCLQIDTKLKESKVYQDILKNKLQLNNLSQLEYNWAVQDFLLYLDRHPELFNQENATQIQIDNTMSAFNLNQILYGPPGTGKTFELQNTHFDNFTIRETALSREQYLESVVADLTWWQVISIAVLDLGKTKVNDIVNHEFIKIKEKLSSSKTVRPTIWGQLQSHTVLVCPYVNVSSRSEPLYFSKTEDSRWTIDEKLLEDYYPEAKNILAISKNYKPSNDTFIQNFDFVTFHQSFSYEDFVEGIKPRLDEGETEVAFEIKDGIFKKLCIKAEADPTNNYAIFIDEINRGNVSAIFGELITLIEDDKRLGATNELRVKLPYSKREFGVPSNLYIIGTMNTADRSVEALDTALRRRFSFTEMMPKPELLQDIQFDGFNLREVLETINDRIEILLDRDHAIGHSYFLKVESGNVESLKSVFKNSIFPLLQEYFYHDYEKIALILGSGFVEVKENYKVNFPKFNNLDAPEI
ncbi:MAG: AAA family ATPase, partial [Bacteroidetes bacterium]|nr:AAA family ATPase [Bacteroidota bacterium]